MADHVQTVNATATAVLTVTTGSITTTPGSLVVIVGIKNNTTEDSTVSDSKSNSWTQNPNSPVVYTGNNRVCQFYTENLANAGSSHTFSQTSTELRDCSIFVQEHRGILTSGALDKSTSQAQAASTSITTGATASRSQAQEVLIACFGAESANIVSVTAGTGFIVPTNGSITSNASGMPGGIEYQYVSVIGTDAGTFTIGASFATGSIIGTFKIPDPPSFRQRTYRPAPFKAGLAR